MENKDKTRAQLLREVDRLKNRVRQLEDSERAVQALEERLDEQRRLYLDLSNTSPAGIYRSRVSPKGRIDSQWKDSRDAPFFFEFINDRFCEILKVSRQIAETRPGLFLEMVFEDDKAGFARENSRANQELTPFLWEGRVVIEGSIIWVHCESLPRALGNGDIIWTGILYDITRRIENEQIIKNKTRELLNANAEKDKFFSIIAHDLRSPLSSITGYSRMLGEQIQSRNLLKVKDYAETISLLSQNSIDLLTNLIEWSQSQTGMMTYTPELFQIKDAIDDSLFLFADIAEQKSIRIIKGICQGEVYGDKKMISSILRNLMSNAVKFTEPGGEIIVSTRSGSGEVMVAVKDTGVGICESVCKTLFSIRGNSSTQGTRGETGTGLGLILCKEFVLKNKGKIWVESTVGKGAVFSFTLPVNGDGKTQFKGCKTAWR